MIVFIPTAGLGKRLKENTEILNKSLLDLNNKPIISHIIEKFPNNTKFLIALGYKGDILKKYLKLVYKDRKINFVNIHPFKGKNSGLGLTLLKSSKYLKKPFLFISCDTLVKNGISFKNYDWIGYSNKKSGNEYRSIDIKKGKLIRINEKNIKHKNKKTYIGLAFIKNYKDFWNYTKQNYKFSKNQGEVFALNKLSKKNNVYSKNFTWEDTGSIINYEKIKLNYLKKNQPIILKKKNEAIWFVNGLVIKYSSDEKFIKKRVKRSKILKDFVPRIVDSNKYMYSYRFVEGEVMSKNLTLNKFKFLLNYLKKFWVINNVSKNKNFELSCLKFYKNKTYSRIKMFNKKYNFTDRIQFINNFKVEKMKMILKKTNWKLLSNGISSRFHGDLHFENIIINKNKFKFLDWRQDFENNLKKGDLYYDLAKLLHGIIVDHNQVNKNNFRIDIKRNKVFLKIRQSSNHKTCLKYFEKWLINNGYNLKKVRILTALIFINIAPLHHHPYSLFLYFLGKKMLSDQTKKEFNNIY
tara:strand:- start:8553 stop:10121 length:1569 start_codon:yes stop_codon:yes gene_type:complete